MRERDIEAKFYRYAQKQGCFAPKLSSPGRRFLPDRIVICPGGDIFFIEFKTATGCLSPGQKRMINKLTDLGCRVDVCRSFEQAKQLLDAVLSLPLSK